MKLYEHYDLVNKVGKATTVESSQASIAKGFMAHLKESREVSHPLTEEKVLWGVKKGDPDWKEQIITTNSEAIPKARAWALENGFHRLRVSEFDLNDPKHASNFAATVDVKKASKQDVLKAAEIMDR